MGNGEEEMKILWGLGLPPERRHIAPVAEPLIHYTNIYGSRRIEGSSPFRFELSTWYRYIFVFFKFILEFNWFYSFDDSQDTSGEFVNLEDLSRESIDTVS